VSRAAAIGYPVRQLQVAYGLAAVAFVLQASLHLVNEYAFDGAYDALNADTEGEGNVFTWASSSATFAAAVFAGLLAVSSPGRRRFFGVLAGILAFFSLDDVVMVHERVALEILAALGLDSFWVRATWPVVMLPLLAFVAVGLWRLAASASPGHGRALRAGLGLLVFAVAIEVALAAVPTGGRGWELIEPAEVAVEEAAELAGWIVIAAGLAGIFAGRVSTAPEDDF
jgi:hypothetical protein